MPDRVRNGLGDGITVTQQPQKGNQMDWTKARGASYIAALAIGMAFVGLNLGTFDPQTGMVDPHPFNLYMAVGVAGAFIGAPLMALIAVVRGWGRK